MPVYSDTGSANKEIGAVYADNGSANLQVKEIYADSGTANRLIYQSQTDFYPGQTPATAQGGGNGNMRTGNFWAETNQADGGWARAYISADLTPIRTLKISYYYNVQRYIQLFIGVCTNFDVHAADMNRNGYIKKSAVYYLGSEESNGMESTATATLDVSDLSGSYYIGIQAYSGSSILAYCWGQISSIVGE